MKTVVVLLALLGSGLVTGAEPPPIEPLPSLDLNRFAGTWYQVALYPNRFQAQCVSDTTATYRILPAGTVDVLNRCLTADGRVDEAKGLARPDDASISASTLSPARLQVSFLPAWLRWTGLGWGRYWIVQRAEDYRYAVVSEPTRQYLWILSRHPGLADDDDRTIRAKLVEQGFNLGRLQSHPQAETRTQAQPPGPAPDAPPGH